MINIEVAYALPTEQLILELHMPAGSTVQEAIDKCGILQRFPEIDLARNRVGIFSKLVSLETLLHEGDRVEIYRPLLIDPKQARRARANKNKRGGD